MLMLCWFYCIPFVWFAWFAVAPVLFVFSLFMLKRGIRQARSGMRQTAFLFMFIAILKLLMVDLRSAKQYLLCDWLPSHGFKTGFGGCDKFGLIMTDIFALLLVIGASFILLHYYRVYLRNRTVTDTTPEQVHLSLWANVSLLLVSGMVVWVSAPWVGFLTIGRIPNLFMEVSWKYLAFASLATLLVGFWKSESCVWTYDAGQKHKAAHITKTWTPRDTLWLNVFIYLIALALSYVTHDVLAAHLPR